MGDAIAVVGMACRVPGAESPEEFWELMMSGGDPISPTGPDRWAGRLSDVAGFDGGFFGMSPREARAVDPQQRLLLEVAHEAFQDAGIPVSRLAGSDAGVFVAQHTSDYALLPDTGDDLHSAMGSAVRGITSGRLSFAFDLRGPSVTVDAACSSALVAVHLAAQSLRSRECSYALVGGVNLALLPTFQDAFAAAGMAAADGRCKFGDARADGFVRSDGIAAVLLKPLADAQRDGDRAHAVLLGSAVSNDGRSSGYLATPAVEGQERMLRIAYRDAGVDPADVDYVEAHGTGTPVGDPVELGALARVLGPGRAADRPCLVGSAKSTIGHTESAAGLVGLIRACLCLRHATVPPTPRLGELTPDVDWSALRIPRTATALPDVNRPLLVGVSSFGLSGTNAHVVLAGPPVIEIPVDVPDRAGQDRPVLYVVSAGEPAALDELVIAHRARLQPGGVARDTLLADLARATAERRDQLEHRIAVVARSHDEAVTRLSDALAGRFGRRVARGGPVPERPRVAFVFPGQGGQWRGMGRDLLASEPVFARAVVRCDEVVRAEVGWSVLEQLTSASADRATEFDVVQPVLWTFQVSLAELWRSWGVRPDVVIGHSMGEVAAAHVAGALSLADAAAVICRRSRCARPLRGRGGMVLTALDQDAALAAISGHEDTVAVAACNGPDSTVLAGDRGALAAIVDRLAADGSPASWIAVDIASHSPQTEAVLDELTAGLGALAPRGTTVPMRSTVTGERLGGGELDAGYWAANLRRPVRFLDAVRAELAEGCDIVLEVGPHPVLTTAVADIAAAEGVAVTALASLRSGEPDREHLLGTLGGMFVAGLPVTGTAAAGPGPDRHVALPRYPWQHTEHWVRAAAGARPPVPGHPLLGAEQPAADGRREWRGPLDRGRHAFLDDHRVDGMVIVPGTVYVELVTAAATRVVGGAVTVRDLRFEQALFLADGAEPELSTRVEQDADGTLRCTVSSRSVSSRSEQGWVQHMSASAAPADTTAPDPGEAPADLARRCPTRIDGADFYRAQAGRGNDWGPRFRGVADLWTGPDSTVGRLECSATVAADLAAWVFHPAWLDACLHPLAAAAGGTDGVFVLAGIDEIRTFRPAPSRLWSRVRSVRADPGGLCGDLVVVDDAGEPVVEVRGLRFRCLPAPAAAPVVTAAGDGLHRLRWRSADTPRSTSPAAGRGTWIVLTAEEATGGENTGDDLVERLRTAGAEVVRVRAAGAFGRHADDEFTADPTVPEHLLSVVADVGRRGRCRGVVHLWSAGIGHEGDRDALGAGSLAGLVRALDEPTLGTAALWLVTTGAQALGEPSERHAPFQAPIWGMGRALAVEEPQLDVVLVDVEPGAAGATALLAELLAATGAAPSEDQLVLRGGRRWAARLERWDGEDRPGGAAVVRSTRPGDLDGLALVPCARPVPGPGEVRIAVAHVGLNFQDVLIGTDLFPAADATGLGKCCAGVIDMVGAGITGLPVGAEVVALAPATMATHVVTPALLTVRTPAGISLADAATLPVPFVTALHGLVDVAALQAGETVLIHSAAGGVGLAALQIALWCGATVLATAGTPEKRAMLLAAGASRVADSRSTAFADEFRAATGGRGVDVVLNSLAGAAVPAGLDLLGPYGRYVELSKKDFQDNTPIGCSALRGNRTFASVDVVHMITDQPGRAAALLRRVVDLVDRGVLRPLPHERFPATAPPEPFRRMATAAHVGRVLLSFPSEVPRPDATYLVTGGLGALGRAAADHLVDRGARHLLLTGRTPLPPRSTWTRLPAGSPHAAAVALVGELETRGAHVEVAAVDVADHDAMSAVLAVRERAGAPAVRGVWHLAGVLGLQAVRDLTADDVTAGLAAKVDGAWTLHRLLPDLDHLVLFSSASAVLGSPMLGVYAAGNAFLDGLGRFRRAQGLPATVVDWGYWEEPGMAVSARDPHAALRPTGVGTIAVQAGLRMLDAMLAGGVDTAVVMPVDWAAWAVAHPAAAAAPLLRELVAGSGNPPGSDPRPVAAAAPAPVTEVRVPLAVPVGPRVEPATSPTVTVRGSAAATVRGHAAAVLGMAADELSVDRALQRVGLDSLMAAELRAAIDRATGVRLPIGLLLGAATVASLDAAVHERLAGDRAAPAVAG